VLEGELFGFEKGAFTGAYNQHRGSFEQADKGTLFLDEIGSASHFLQERLLRVLEQKTFERIGGYQPISVNIRIVAATNIDRFNAVEDNYFRDDLYYRLNVVTLEIPPLRERSEDIPVLVKHFLTLFSRKFGKQIRISDQAIEAMMNYSWPGNVRELKHAIEQAVLQTNSACIESRNLDLEKRQGKSAKHYVNSALNFQAAMNGFKRAFLKAALCRYKGNVTLTAKKLKISRKALYNHMQTYGIDPETYRTDKEF